MCRRTNDGRGDEEYRCKEGLCTTLPADVLPVFLFSPQALPLRAGFEERHHRGPETKFVEDAASGSLVCTCRCAPSRDAFGEGNTTTPARWPSSRASKPQEGVTMRSAIQRFISEEYVCSARVRKEPSAFSQSRRHAGDRRCKEKGPCPIRPKCLTTSWASCMDSPTCTGQPGNGVRPPWPPCRSFLGWPRLKRRGSTLCRAGAPKGVRRTERSRAFVAQPFAMRTRALSPARTCGSPHANSPRTRTGRTPMPLFIHLAADKVEQGGPQTTTSIRPSFIACMSRSQTRGLAKSNSGRSARSAGVTCTRSPAASANLITHSSKSPSRRSPKKRCTTTNTRSWPSLDPRKDSNH